MRAASSENKIAADAVIPNARKNCPSVPFMSPIGRNTATIVKDAERHGVDVLSIGVNRSALIIIR